MLKVLRAGRAETVRRMKLEDMERVEKLANKREELLKRRQTFQDAANLEVKTTRERLTQQIATGFQENAEDENAVLLFAAVRQALSDYFDRELRGIDEDLRTLGVEP